MCDIAWPVNGPHSTRITLKIKQITLQGSLAAWDIHDIRKSMNCRPHTSKSGAEMAEKLYTANGSSTWDYKAQHEEIRQDSLHILVFGTRAFITKQNSVFESY
jgi:hypothetical protein